jgi:hypothetical protein
MKDVDIKTTVVKPKRLNGKSSLTIGNHSTKPLIIADLRFLFRLFRQYPGPFPAGVCQPMHLPDVLAQGLPTGMARMMSQWQQSGAVSILKTGDALFEEAIKLSVNPGMQTTDYVAILAARQGKQTIITSTKIITHEAKRLKVSVTNGDVLLQNIGNGKPTEVVNQIRVRKNNISPAGAPAPIAGNVQKFLQ